MRFRLYQTLVEVSGEASSTIVFPVPIELMGGMAHPGASASSPQAMQAMMQSGDGAGGAGGGPGAARGGPRDERSAFAGETSVSESPEASLQRG